MSLSNKAPENVVLIGMPGAGKSTVGVILAKTIGYDFVDTDIAICQKCGRTLQELIDRVGLEEFLKIEEETVCDLKCRRTVIATGGSVPMSDRAMEHLTGNALTVFLNVPLSELERRITNITTRGIAFKPNQTLKELFEERQPLYRKYADLTVPECETERSVEEISNALRRKNV